MTVTARYAVALLCVFLLAACGAVAPPPLPDTPLAGTAMDGDPAPDFRLIDENGAELTLSSLRGKAVVLIFQYSYCPDTLPEEMAAFLAAREALAEQANDVVFLAVTVDPERDSVERLHQYLEGQAAIGKVKFVTGDRSVLEPLWKAYFLWVNRFPVKAGSPDSRRYGAYSVGHTDVIYLVDRMGRLRLLMRPDFETSDLIGNLRALMRE